MRVCHCSNVSHQAIRDALGAGASTLDEIAERTGAGVRCKGCLPAVEELLAEHRAGNGRPLDVVAAE
jgi:bacterioferritin-associated ferredoxin